MGLLRGLILSLALAFMPGASALSAQAKTTKKATAKKAKTAKPAKAKSVVKKPVRSTKSRRPLTADERMAQLKAQYRSGEIQHRTLWEELDKLEQKNSGLSAAGRQSLLQLQATMLAEGKFPILGSLYAAEAIKSSNNPASKDLTQAWSILARTSEKRSIQLILEQLVQDTKLVTKAPPEFGTNWFYHVGNAFAMENQPKRALEAYRRLRMQDRYFIPAKYQTAMINISAGDYKQANVALQSMLNSAPQTLSPMSAKELKEMNNYAKLALARLFYEDKQFKNAIRFFRAVDRDSSLFYEAIFEQSWAFFMAGYPNHSLGALHGAESPFFAQVFNPEASVLRAINYYWLCRYDDSRNALADFSERHSKAVESLGEFLDRKRLTNDTAYQLFENMISGVSDDSLGVPKAILSSAANQEAMMLLRNQYASLVVEMDLLDSAGIFGSTTGSRKGQETLQKQTRFVKNALGEQYIVELRAMKAQFDRLYEQAQFLYVELLMSEKEQLLGRELHASTKLDKISKKRNISSWGEGDQSWSGANMKDEYWWDEVGFYIYKVEPKCNNTHAQQ